MHRPVWDLQQFCRIWPLVSIIVTPSAAILRRESPLQTHGRFFQSSCYPYFLWFLVLFSGATSSQVFWNLGKMALLFSVVSVPGRNFAASAFMKAAVSDFM